MAQEELPQLRHSLRGGRHPGRTPSNAARGLVELLMTDEDGIVPPKTEREREK